MDKLKILIKKYKSIILYMIFGAGTTIVNILTYYLLYELLGISNVSSTITALFFAVLFAFITNKIWVFESKSFKFKALFHEVIYFFGCRAATGVIDVVTMYVAVDIMGQHPTFWKIISNIIVITLNYIASKLLIFKKK